MALHGDHQVRRRPPPGLERTSASLLHPATGEVLPTWEEALTAIGDHDEPWHVARFGDRFDAQGVLAGSKTPAGASATYQILAKHVGDCHQASTEDQAAHANRLAETLRYEPCSPTCANWLRYGIQPKNARPGLRPGCCKGKAHRPEHLGYGGRRVLVSREWSGKTLADHRADRKAWLIGMLGLSATDPSRYTWNRSNPVTPTTCPTASDSCTSSPTASNGKSPSTKPADEPPFRPPLSFRQPGRLHDGGAGPMSVDRAYGKGARMLTLDELCEWLNITERHARKLVERDAIPYRKVGHLLRFPEAEIEEWSHPPRRTRRQRYREPTNTLRPSPKRRITRSILPKSLIE